MSEQQVYREADFDAKLALWPFLKRIFKFGLRHKKYMIGFIVATLGAAVIDAIIPLMGLFIIDYALVPELARWKAEGASYEPNYDLLWKYGIAYLIMGLAQIPTVWYLVKYAGGLAEKVIWELREEMFSKLQRLSFSYYDKNSSGWLLTRMTADADRVAQVVSWGLLEFVWGLSMIIFCLAAMFIYNYKLALIVLVSVPLLMVASVGIRRLVLAYSRKSRKLNSEITSSYTEHINGVKVVKSLARENYVSTRFQRLTNEMRQSSFRGAYYTSMYFPLVMLIGSITSALVFIMGGNLLLAGTSGITLGILTASLDYAMRIYWPVVEISLFYSRAQDSLSAGERIFSLLDEEVEITDGPNSIVAPKFEGQVHFENLTFEYLPGQPVLTGINLEIPSGQSVALVGATGDGKSTLIKLLGRFYEPTSGQLLIDGKNYLDFTLNSLRSQLGIVLQDPHLFQGTVRDNIQYVRDAESETEIIKALGKVGGEELIPRLDEEVGEEGKNLSRGERQIVAFARAIFSDPSILILDEATSSIDTITERRIQEGISKMIKSRTSIVIAHRLSTIRSCDRIVVIQKGQVVEDGTHLELFKKRGVYFNFYIGQLRASKRKEVIDSI